MVTSGSEFFGGVSSRQAGREVWGRPVGSFPGRSTRPATGRGPCGCHPNGHPYLVGRPRIPTPAALVWGRHDRMTPLSLAEAARARLGLPLHVVDDAGHVPHIEAPGAFADALARATADRAPIGAGPRRP